MTTIRSILIPLFITFSIFLLSYKVSGQQEEIREYLDLQVHPTMHVPYKFFGEGMGFFDSNDTPKLKYKHQFKNVNYANFYVKNEGVRIMVCGALTNEGIKSKKKARKLIVEQIDYLDSFAMQNPEEFVVARNPAELRKYVAETDKTIIVHSIEGAKKVINSAKDAEFYAQKGVAFVTLIHLRDYAYGGAGIRPGLMTHLINLKGVFRKNRKRGLTNKGARAILWLANAGIMTDLTHMSPQTRLETLDFMEQHNLPPLVTHDGFYPIQHSPRGVDTASVKRIYRAGGLMSLPLSGSSLEAHKPQEPYKSELDSLLAAGCHCPGSIDSYKYTYLALKSYIESEVQCFYRDSLYYFKDLPDSAKTMLSIGFQSDFNGWLSHHRPRYGKKGCYELEEGKSYEAIELEGMAHPGLLPSHWRLLEKEEVDLQPIKRSSERFVQLWELFQERKGSFEIEPNHP